MSSTQATITSPPKTRFAVSEDWTVVLLGGLIILLAIAGFLLPVPVFGWSNTAELTSKVLNAGNLGIIALQFLLVFTIGGLGATLIGKPLKSYLLVFPVVYVLTVLALILAGNKQVKALNL
jgi:hypothetical protein